METSSKDKMTQCLVRSSVHMKNLDTAMNSLLTKERFIDVTLACDGHKFHCHRLILAASSPLFEELLMDNPSTHPIVIIPGGIKSATLKSLIDFIYMGHTSIRQAELRDLMESAKLLQVTGLQYAETEFHECSDEYIEEDMEYEGGVDHEEDNQAYQELQALEKSNHELEYEHKVDENVATTSESEIVNTQDSIPEQTIVDIITIEDSQDVPNHNEEFIDIEDSNEVVANHSFHDTETDANSNTSISKLSEPNNEDVAFKDNDQVIADGAKFLQISAPQQQTTPIPTIRVKPTIKLINLFKLTGGPIIADQKSPKNSQVPWTYIHIPQSTTGQNPETSTQASTTAQVKSLSWAEDVPQLKVRQSVDNNQQTSASHSDRRAVSDKNLPSVSSFLKFNSSKMAISIKTCNHTNMPELSRIVNTALDQEPQTEVPVQANASEQALTARTHVKNEIENSPESNYIELGETKLCEADFPMFYAMIKKEREEQAAQIVKENIEAEENFTETEAENIICQPSVSYICGSAEDDGKEDECDENEVGVCIDYDRLVAETYGNEEEEVLRNQRVTKPKRTPKKKQLKPTKSNGGPYFPSSIPLKEDTLENSPALFPLPGMHTDLGSKDLYYSDHKGKIIFHKDKSVFSTLSRTNPNEGETHSPQTVILRNPRCNQPRHYSTESLFNALMAVKYGESIYRASRMHQVPRKTLRNWMKRWDIKSQFPMPKQLEDAAKKKRQNHNT